MDDTTTGRSFAQSKLDSCCGCVSRAYWKGNQTAGLAGTTILKDLHAAYDGMFMKRVSDSYMKRATGLNIYFPRTPDLYDPRYCRSVTYHMDACCVDAC